MIRIEVPRNSIFEFKKRFARLKKRAARCGVEIDFAWEEPDEKLCWVTATRERANGTKFHFEVRIALIDAPSKIRLGSWEVVAMMERIEGATIINSLDEGSRPHLRQLNKIPCDHCFMDRRRTRGWVVKSEGEEKLVGSSCLEEYTGISPAAALFLAGFTDTVSDWDDDFFGGGGAARSADTTAFMHYAARFVRDFGYRSHRNVEINGGIATSLLIKESFFSKKPVKWLDTISAEDAADLGDEVMEWVDSMDPGDSDYLMNLKETLSLSYIPIRLMGIAASAITAYDRAKGIEAEKKSILDEYVGEIKKRLALRLTCLRTYDTEGAYGPKTGHFMRDQEGHQFQWWSTSGCKLKPGETKDVKATVKDHKLDREGIKVTVLTRLKVDE